MRKIGITGPIASGKSQLENILREKFLVIDLDTICHIFLETTASDEVMKEFNTIDRKELASIVFKDENKRKKLEDILHPRLKKYLTNLFNTSEEEVIFVSGALLYEKGFFDFFDSVIYVDAIEKLRFERLKKRNDLTDEQANLKMVAQNPEGKKYCDFIIDNNGSLDELKVKLDDILKELNLS